MMAWVIVAMEILVFGWWNSLWCHGEKSPNMAQSPDNSFRFIQYSNTHSLMFSVNADIINTLCWHQKSQWRRLIVCVNKAWQSLWRTSSRHTEESLFTYILKTFVTMYKLGNNYKKMLSWVAPSKLVFMAFKHKILKLQL